MPQPTAESCQACAFDSTRRTFLREAGVAAAGILVLLGAMPSVASAVPLTVIAPLNTESGTRTYAIPLTDGTSIDTEAEVILTRWRGAVYAFNLACPHRNTALRWLPADGRFQCPKHKSKYQPDGAFISGKATRGMDRFSVRRSGSSVIVNLDQLYNQSDDPTGWAAATIAV